MLTTKECLVLDSGRILHYVIKKKGVRKKQKDRSEQKSPSQFHHTKRCLIALPFLPVWPIPFETQQVEKKKEKSLLTVMRELYWSFSSPAHLQGTYYWNSCWRGKQKSKNLGSLHKGQDLTLTPVHTGGEERIQERHPFPGPLESLGCFSSCSARFKGARVWGLLVPFYHQQSQVTKAEDLLLSAVLIWNWSASVSFLVDNCSAN